MIGRDNGRIVLVSVSGNDKPGLMAMLTSTLTEYQASLLDIGQAVIHDQLALGLLVEVATAADAGLRAALDTLATQTGAAIAVSDISDTAYAHWVEETGTPRFILTLLCGAGLAAALHAVSSVTREHGWNIDTIRRLSARVPVERIHSPRRSIVEMRIRGDSLNLPALQAELMGSAAQLGFDFSVQADTVFRRNRRLVALDMDSTLINAEVIDELARLHGVGEQVAAITERAMRGELDFQQSFRARAALLAGLPQSALKQVAESVRLNDGAEVLLKVLKQFGYRIAVLSGGFQFVGEWLKARLPIDYVYANELVVRDGVMSGEVQGGIVDAERKAALLRDLAAREHINLEQTIAIGDGANDLPMLGVAGLGVAYHAKPLVRESARHAISNFGLDAVLYLMGFSERDIQQTLR